MLLPFSLAIFSYVACLSCYLNDRLGYLKKKGFVPHYIYFVIMIFLHVYTLFIPFCLNVYMPIFAARERIASICCCSITYMLILSGNG